MSDEPTYSRGGMARIVILAAQPNEPVNTIYSPTFSWDAAEAELAQISAEVKANQSIIQRKWLSIHPGYIRAAYLAQHGR